MSKLFHLLVAAIAVVAIAPATAGAQLQQPAGAIQQLPEPNDCVTTDDPECGTTINGGTRTARDIAITPDGKNAYVVASSGTNSGNTGSIATFSRNGNTGALSFVGCQKDTSSTEACAANVGLLRGAVSVVATNNHVYVASATENAVIAFSRNAGTGALTRIGGTTGCVSESGNSGTCEDGVGLSGVNFLVMSPDGQHIYAISSSASTIAVLDRDPGTGGITQPNPATTGCYRGSNGPGGCGAADTTGLNGVSAADVSEDGADLYAISNSSRTLVTFRRDASTGALTFNQCLRGTSSTELSCTSSGGLNAPTDVEEVTSSGGHANVYVVSGQGTTTPDGPLGNSIAEWDRDTTDGDLTFDECMRDDDQSGENMLTQCNNGVFAGLGQPTSLAASPNDAQLYVTTQGDHSVTVVNRNTADGDLTQDPDSDDRCVADVDGSTDCDPNGDGLTAVRELAISPNGVFLYTVSPSDNAVAEFIIQAPPVCQDITVPTSPQNQSIQIPLQCTDPNSGDILTYSVVSQPANGNVTISGDTATYSPDNGFAGNDSFTYRATDQAGNQSNAATVNVNVASGATPTVTIDDETVNENQGTATFTITLSSPTTTTVSFATENQSATSGSDYTAASGTRTFTGGDLTETVVVNIGNDTIDEVTESFRVRLTNATNGVAIADNTGTGTIVDDDTAAITIADDVVNEHQGPATFTVTLSNVSTRTVNATYSTANGTATAPADYTGRSNQTVSFAPGETQKVIAIPIANDNVVEQTETFSVVLTNATGGAVFNDANAQGSIIDDEQPSLAVSDTGVAEGDADTRNAVFTVTLSAPTTGTTTVSYATQDGTAQAGSDYDTTSGTLSFATGETTKTVSVPVRGDTVVEGDESFTLRLSNASNASIGDGEGAGTIQNDDAAAPPPRNTLVVSDSGLSEGDSGRRNLVFTVALAQAASAPVTVDFATGGGNATAGTDYVATRGTLAFAAGETSKQIVVPIVGDTVFEPDEAFGVALTNAAGADIARGAGIGTIANDDIQRVLPGVEFTVTPARDRTRPYSFVVSGRIIRPAGVTIAQGCNGVVNIQYKAGGNTISNRRTTVNRACRFSRRTTFRNPRRLRNRNGRLEVIVRFQGNEYLLRRNAPRVFVRAG